MKPRPESISPRIVTLLFLTPVFVFICYLYSLFENGVDDTEILKTFISYRSRATSVFFFIFLSLSIYQQFQTNVILKDPNKSAGSINRFIPPAILAILLLSFSYTIAEFLSNLL